MKDTLLEIILVPFIFAFVLIAIFVIWIAYWFMRHKQEMFEEFVDRLGIDK